MPYRVTYCDEARPETRYVRDIEAEGPCIAIELVRELALGAYPAIEWPLVRRRSGAGEADLP